MNIFVLSSDCKLLETFVDVKYGAYSSDPIGHTYADGERVLDDNGICAQFIRSVVGFQLEDRPWRSLVQRSNQIAISGFYTHYLRNDLSPNAGVRCIRVSLLQRFCYGDNPLSHPGQTSFGFVSGPTGGLDKLGGDAELVPWLAQAVACDPNAWLFFYD